MAHSHPPTCIHAHTHCTHTHYTHTHTHTPDSAEWLACFGPLQGDSGDGRGRIDSAHQSGCLSCPRLHQRGLRVINAEPDHTERERINTEPDHTERERVSETEREGETDIEHAFATMFVRCPVKTCLVSCVFAPLFPCLPGKWLVGLFRLWLVRSLEAHQWVLVGLGWFYREGNIYTFLMKCCHGHLRCSA